MRSLVFICLLMLVVSTSSEAGTVRLEGRSLLVEVDDATGRWVLMDKRSGARWPTKGMASPGTATWLEGDFLRSEMNDKTSVRLPKKDGAAMVFALVEGGTAL
jgi:hypothetical protein